MCLKGKNMLEETKLGGGTPTNITNASKDAVYGITVYPDKVYLYWQFNMKTASMIGSMQTSPELGRQTPLNICELVPHSSVISK